MKNKLLWGGVLALFSTGLWGQESELKLNSQAETLARLAEGKLSQITFEDLGGNQNLLGDRKGNGGDSFEMSFINIGWEIYELLLKTQEEHLIDMALFEQKLTTLRVEIVRNLALNGASRQAVNIPSENKILIDEKLVQFLTRDDLEIQNEKRQFFLHEFMPILGILDEGYEQSRKLLETFSNEKREGPIKVVLFSKNFERDRSGVSFGEAHALCERQKKIFSEAYFHVYCTFHEKNWTTYAYQFSAYEWESEYLRRWGRSFNYEYDSGRSETTTIYPITHNVFGVRVIGLGPLEDLTEKAVFDASSDDYFGYNSARAAKRACVDMIYELDDSDFRYYKAYCEVEQSADQRYRFKILTKNPLL